VAKNKPNLLERIDEAQKRITEVFVQQCTYGAQTSILPEEFAACGQFIGDDAKTIDQYGLHGIAAALRVLGPCPSPECRLIVHRIVSCCEASFGIHPARSLDGRLAGDFDNVIKLGELLYGLYFVTTAQAERDQLVQHVADWLTKSLINKKGWGYFIGEKEPELLPSAYAVRGLAQHGYDVSGPRKFLLDSLGAKNEAASSSAADLTTAIACAYCLTFCKGEGTHDPALRSAFMSAWPSFEPLLGEDIEQNLEYWRDTTTDQVRDRKTEYVRIPFQLYLMALAAEYSRWRRFAGFRSQRRLNSTLDALRNASFKYPYSGRCLSSRTNSIAYDALDNIREHVRHFTTLRLAHAVDRIRVGVGSVLIRTTAAAGVVVLTWLSVRAWLSTGGKLSDLAPELLVSFIALVLAWAKGSHG
jgi:hypothetical protein